MPAIDQLVSVQISQNTTTVAQTSFAIPLIVGPSNPGWTNSDKVRTYSAAADLLADGYTSTSPEYLAALAVYSQTLVPSQLKVGLRSPGAAQVDTFTVNTLTVGHAYVLKVNNTQVSYTAVAGDTQQAILGALNTQIMAAAPVTGAVAGTGTSGILTVTASQSGQGVTYSNIDPLLTRVTTVAASGIAQDLANIAAQDNTWYGLTVCGASDPDILQVCAWAEGNRKVYVPTSSTAAIPTSATTDVASSMKAAGYKRSGLYFTKLSNGQGGDAAWLAQNLAQTPGSNTWAFANLAGITADNLSGSEQAILIGNPVAGIAGKNVNIYQQVGGVNIMQMGLSASGQPFDITVGLDWLQSTVQTNIYATLVNNKKIPYTDVGVSILLSAVNAALMQGINNGLIDPDPKTLSLTIDKVASVSLARRASRIAPDIRFSCRLQGAIHAVIVKGQVSV